MFQKNLRLTRLCHSKAYSVPFMSPMQFLLTLRVYIEDADPGGIVYYVNYLKFMERARTEYMRSLGFDRSATLTNDLMFVVRDLKVRYILPAFLDDELTVGAVVTSVGGASFDMCQSVFRSNEKLLEGSLSLAVVDRTKMTPRRLPREMRSALRSEVFDTS